MAAKPPQRFTGRLAATADFLLSGDWRSATAALDALDGIRRAIP